MRDFPWLCYFSGGLLPPNQSQKNAQNPPPHTDHLPMFLLRRWCFCLVQVAQNCTGLGWFSNNKKKRRRSGEDFQYAPCMEHIYLHLA